MGDFLFSPFPVEGLVHFAQLFVGYVRVNLRGGNVAVTEELLDGAQIRAV